LIRGLGLARALVRQPTATTTMMAITIIITTTAAAIIIVVVVMTATLCRRPSPAIAHHSNGCTRLDRQCQYRSGQAEAKNKSRELSDLVCEPRSRRPGRHSWRPHSPPKAQQDH
jgi:hypothetical protein